MINTYKIQFFKYLTVIIQVFPRILKIKEKQMKKLQIDCFCTVRNSKQHNAGYFHFQISTCCIIDLVREEIIIKEKGQKSGVFIGC